MSLKSDRMLRYSGKCEILIVSIKNDISTFVCQLIAHNSTV